MARIAIPALFFKKERDTLYGDWRLSFWREFFQNSIDAGSTRIDITTHAPDADPSFPKNELQIDFSDNGTGMTREVLENVYFRLGETTKSDQDIGGYGRARILTCFSMESYSIRTGNLLVTGQGAEYEIQDGMQFHRGCLVSVRTKDASLATMLDKLNTYLSQSQISCAVFVNGERRYASRVRGEYVKTLEVAGVAFAQVYANKKSEQKFTVVVRVKGASMFETHTRAPAYVLVEISPEMSRKVLVANRDDFASPYRRVLQDFLEQLAIDVTTALKPKRRRFTKTISGIGPIQTGRDSKFVTTQIQTALATANPVERTFFENFQNFRERQIDLNDVYINDECEIPEIRRVINHYDPTNWTATRGTRYKKLLLVWRIVCEEAVKALLAIKDDNGEDHCKMPTISWSVGWHFVDEVGGACCQNINNVHMYCLNPVTKKGTLRYKLTRRSDLRTLAALAKHEVAHTLKSYHDEDFARLVTFIDANFNEKRAYARIRALLGKEKPDVDHREERRISA